MKPTLLLLAVAVAAFSSCSTIYKTGQTPDDVYFSPARGIDEGATARTDDRRTEPAATYYNSDDRMIRMGVSSYRWRYLADDYGYSPYAYSNFNNYNGFNSGFNYNSHNYYSNYYGSSFYTPYDNFYYNDYYNPYYNSYPVYVLPLAPVRNSTPRTANLSGYGSSGVRYNNTNTPASSSASQPARSYNNSNTRSSGLGNVLNKVLTPASSSNNSNYNNTNNNTPTTTRTYTPPPASTSSSSSSSSSSGSSSGGGGRVSRPN